MTFEEAFKMMAKKYFQGVSPEQLKGPSGKKLKYNKKYFDRVAKDYEINQEEDLGHLK